MQIGRGEVILVCGIKNIQDTYVINIMIQNSKAKYFFSTKMRSRTNFSKHFPLVFWKVGKHVSESGEEDIQNSLFIRRIFTIQKKLNFSSTKKEILIENKIDRK